MSCVLSIIGENLDIDTFISQTNIPGFNIKHKGDPITLVSNKKAKHSSASIITSDADFDDIKGQISDTINFLNKYRDNLKHIVNTPEIEYATINFGVDSIIDEAHLIQSFYFTPELVKICGSLGIGIELSTYKEDMQLILEKRRASKGRKS